MKHTAKIKTECRNAREVCKSLDVDNISLEGLSVQTGYDENAITSLVKSNSIRSMLAVIDDLIRCQIAAESVIKDG